MNTMLGRITAQKHDKKELAGIQNQFALFIWIYKQCCQIVATAVIDRLQTQ